MKKVILLCSLCTLPLSINGMKPSDKATGVTKPAPILQKKHAESDDLRNKKRIAVFLEKIQKNAALAQKEAEENIRKDIYFNNLLRQNIRSAQLQTGHAMDLFPIMQQQEAALFTTRQLLIRHLSATQRYAIQPISITPARIHPTLATPVIAEVVIDVETMPTTHLPIPMAIESPAKNRSAIKKSPNPGITPRRSHRNNSSIETESPY